jgi:hypothetical protein
MRTPDRSPSINNNKWNIGLAPRPGATQGSAQNCAVINPYALAELIAGRKIPWTQLPDPANVLEQLLGTP